MDIETRRCLCKLHMNLAILNRQTDQLSRNFEGFYSDPNLDDVVNDFWTPARDDFAKVSGYDCLAVYVNYARGDEGPEAWYGATNLPRLAELKRKWDPNEQFSVNNPVPLRWP